jgi:hypothetical protein
MESDQHPRAAAMVGPENRLTVSLLMVWTFAETVVRTVGGSAAAGGAGVRLGGQNAALESRP